MKRLAQNKVNKEIVHLLTMPSEEEKIEPSDKNRAAQVLVVWQIVNFYLIQYRKGMALRKLDLVGKWLKIVFFCVCVSNNHIAYKEWISTENIKLGLSWKGCYIKMWPYNLFTCKQVDWNVPYTVLKYLGHTQVEG